MHICWTQTCLLLLVPCLRWDTCVRLPWKLCVNDTQHSRHLGAGSFLGLGLTATPGMAQTGCADRGACYKYGITSSGSLPGNFCLCKEVEAEGPFLATYHSLGEALATSMWNIWQRVIIPPGLHVCSFFPPGNLPRTEKMSDMYQLSMDLASAHLCYGPQSNIFLSRKLQQEIRDPYYYVFSFLLWKYYAISLKSSIIKRKFTSVLKNRRLLCVYFWSFLLRYQDISVMFVSHHQPVWESLPSQMSQQCC